MISPAGIVMRFAVLMTMVILGPGFSHGLAAQPFYQGKTLTFIVGMSAGGPTDIESHGHPVAQLFEAPDSTHHHHEGKGKRDFPSTG